MLRCVSWICIFSASVKSFRRALLDLALACERGSQWRQVWNKSISFSALSEEHCFQNACRATELFAMTSIRRAARFLSLVMGSTRICRASLANALFPRCISRALREEKGHTVSAVHVLRTAKGRGSRHGLQDKFKVFTDTAWASN